MKVKFLIPATIAAALLMAPHAGAQDTPKALWLKVKCALCHGEDGTSSTPQGKKTNAPDLTAAEIQELSDGELAKRVEEGHAKMPSFKIQLSKEQIKSLVYYIREIGRQGPKKN
jgi:mono/diheme cytochrome c family protein